MNKQLQKVISGLEHHSGIAEWGCWKDSGEEYNFEKPPVEYCPYYDADSDEITCSQKVMSDAIELLKEYDSALRGMVYQYCTVEYREKEEFFHRFMSAGEEAFRVLGIDNGEEVTDDFIWS